MTSSCKQRRADGRLLPQKMSNKKSFSHTHTHIHTLVRWRVCIRIGKMWPQPTDFTDMKEALQVCPRLSVCLSVCRCCASVSHHTIGEPPAIKHTARRRFSLFFRWNNPKRILKKSLTKSKISTYNLSVTVLVSSSATLTNTQFTTKKDEQKFKQTVQK